jgi:hypothetical protein
MATLADIQAIEEKIKPVLGQQGWDVTLGHGSFITIEFGKPLPSNDPRSPRGEWHLWVYLCIWYLEKNGELLAASEDPRPKLEAAVHHLEHRTLQSVKLSLPALETVFVFDEGITLHLFPVYTEEFEQWFLYAPDGNVLTIGPGTQWTYESSATVSTK